jgi:sulfoxide reductase heme-binding subunit YedZ
MEGLSDMNEQFWWFLSRASGIVAWGLLCAAIVWGILLSTRLMRQVDRPAWLLDLHKWLAALSIAGVVIHLAALVADSYVEFGWRELAVPMASTWQPGPVAWGVIATYFLIMIQVTSLLLRRLPRRFWHLIHLTSYAMFTMTSIHAFTAGTDASNDLFLIFGAMIITLVIALTVVRVLYAMRSAKPERSPRSPRTSAADSDR